MNQPLTVAGVDQIRALLNAGEVVHDPLRDLVAATKENPGAPFAPEIIERLAVLKSVDPARFEELRTGLKAAGCRVGQLDKSITDAARDESGDDRGRRGAKQADVLLELASEAALFCAPDGTAYADIMIDGHRETWSLKAKEFRNWLIGSYYGTTGGAPNSEALANALAVLQARAHAEGPKRPVFFRVGEHEGRLYLDLANETWEAIEVDVSGWRVVDAPPVRFRRTTAAKALPLPERGGTVDALRPFLNVKADRDFVLLIAWMLACLRPSGPYPLLVLSGEQGSAKSTFSAILLALLDPSKAALRALPREERDLFIAATSRHVLAFDNLSGLSPWISDALCRLSTGGGFAVRKLYTDGDETLFEETRPILLNGIVDVVTRADLADRAIMLQLEAIPEERRRSEAEIWAEFEQARPKILGALLDAVSVGLRRLPDVRLGRLPRMADFACWATACETALWPENTFSTAYEGNRSEAVESVVDADPVAAAVRALMVERSEWPGTATKLLVDLGQIVGERGTKAKGWPPTPNALSERLKRAATFLRKLGIEITSSREGHERTRRILITCTSVPAAPDDEGQRSSASSASSAREENQCLGSDFEGEPPRTILVPADDPASAISKIVRSNLPERLAEDDADDADADFPRRTGSGLLPVSWTRR